MECDGPSGTLYSPSHVTLEFAKSHSSGYTRNKHSAYAGNQSASAGYSRHLQTTQTPATTLQVFEDMGSKAAQDLQSSLHEGDHYSNPSAYHDYDGGDPASHPNRWPLPQSGLYNTYGTKPFHTESIRGEKLKCSCPKGSELCRDCKMLNHKAPMIAGWLVLFLVGICLYFVTYERSESMLLTMKHFVTSTANPILPGRQKLTLFDGPIFLVALMNCVASIGYFALALGFGSTFRASDGREFFWARYVEWGVAIMFQLWALSNMSDGDATLDVMTTTVLIVISEIMVAAGAFGSYYGGAGESSTIHDDTYHAGGLAVRWVLWGFGIVCLLLVFFVIFLKQAPPSRSALSAGVVQESKDYRSISSVLGATWLMYPLVWILCEGTGAICVTTEAWLYVLVDVVTKLSFTAAVVNAARRRQEIANQGNRPTGVGDLQPLLGNGSSLI